MKGKALICTGCSDQPCVVVVVGGIVFNHKCLSDMAVGEPNWEELHARP